MRPSDSVVPKPPLTTLLPDLLWVPSALVALFFMLSYAVDLPSIDQWDGELPFIMKAMNGSAGLEDLIAQQLEHRIASVRLVGTVVARFADWHPTVHLFFNWVLMCATAANLSRLIRHTNESNVWRRGIANLLGGSFFFGLPQFDLWLNVMMGTWAAAELLLTSALVVMTWTTSLRTKCLACMGLAFVGTFTSSLGLVLLPVFSALLILASYHAKDRLTAGWWVTWGATCLGLVAAYFYGYQRPPESVSDPASAAATLSFFLCLLGSPFAYGTTVPATAMAALAGVILLSCLAICGAYAATKIRDPLAFGKVMPWCALAGFGFTVVSLVTIGRAGQGVEVALASRYLGAPILIVFAVIVLAPWAIDYATAMIPQSNWVQRASGSVRLSAMLISGLFTAMSLLHCLYSIQSRQSYEDVRRRLLAAKAAVLFSRSFVDSELLSNVWSYKTVRNIEAKLDFLDQAGFLRPKTFRTAAIEPLRSKNVGMTAAISRGALEQAARPAPDRVAFSGWAIAPEFARAADVVLLTWEDDDTAPTVFGIAPVGGERLDIVQKMGAQKYLKSGWGRVFPSEALPKAKCRIRAWSLLVDAGLAYELQGSADWNPE